MRSRAWSIAFACVATCGLLGLLACGEQTPEVEVDAAAVEQPTPVEFTPELESVLARADLADGTEDHVVSKCPGCALAMEGTAEQAVQLGGYALHFCSDDCRERFEANPTKGLMALELPDESEPEATP